MDYLPRMLRFMRTHSHKRRVVMVKEETDRAYRAFLGHIKDVYDESLEGEGMGDERYYRHIHRANEVIKLLEFKVKLLELKIKSDHRLQ